LSPLRFPDSHQNLIRLLQFPILKAEYSPLQDVTKKTLRGVEDMRKLGALWTDEAGTESMEWGLVCGLIVVGAIVAMAAMGPKVGALWESVRVHIPPIEAVG
jgi:Flp pilus assembly pilin Flp